MGMIAEAALTQAHAGEEHQIVNWQMLSAVTHDQMAALQRLWTDTNAMVHKA